MAIDVGAVAYEAVGPIVPARILTRPTTRGNAPPPPSTPLSKNAGQPIIL
jgi:hypothetical protein